MGDECVILYRTSTIVYPERNSKVARAQPEHADARGSLLLLRSVASHTYDHGYEQKTSHSCKGCVPFVFVVLRYATNPNDDCVLVRYTLERRQINPALFSPSSTTSRSCIMSLALAPGRYETNSGGDLGMGDAENENSGYALVLDTVVVAR